MIAIAIRKDWWFFGGLFMAWAAGVFLMHNGYRYFGTAIPSIAIVNQPDVLLRQSASLASSVEELQKKLLTEKDPTEHAHIQHNIGQSFYDIYTVTRNRVMLDSAGMYFAQSIKELPTVARFFYNLARVYTEKGMHDQARINYQQALALDPMHVLAMHNLGLLTFFELGKPEEARELLQRALNINAFLPICNYVLGEIALETKDYSEALRRFSLELTLSASNYGAGASNIPASRASIEYALRMTHLELAGMYSSRFPNRDSAQQHFNAYYASEPDPNARQEALGKIQKFWVIAQPGKK
jgi:tetratricopeptide (TPR) repeat protein